jgi:hydrogenase-4 component B
MGGIAPQAAFEYTATSYAKLIRLYFGPILRPEREIRVERHPGTPFARSIHYRGEVRPLVGDHFYAWLRIGVVRAAEFVRRLQGGSLQLYLAYSVAALVALLLIAR